MRLNKGSNAPYEQGWGGVNLANVLQIKEHPASPARNPQFDGVAQYLHGDCLHLDQEGRLQKGESNTYTASGVLLHGQPRAF